MQYCKERSWYVIRIRSQSERLVQVGLHKKDFEVLNPTYQALSPRKDRRKVLSKPIFKGYMFLHALLDSESHLEVLKTPGVVEILQNRKGPTPVPNEQVENVRILEKHVGDCFHGKYLATGDVVIVRDGPLTGLKGVIDRMDHKKLHIYVDAIPGSVMIEVEPHQVQLEKDSVYTLVKADKLRCF
jgi:transcription antitermination factor NusG